MLPETLNAEYIESQYAAWKDDPESVSRDWQYFFKGFDVAASGGVAGAVRSDKGMPSRQAHVERLIYGYRHLGHILACMDPLSACPTEHPLLSLDAFGLDMDDLDSYFYTDDFSETGGAKLKEILAWLKETYCHSIGVEYMHLQDPEERRWLRKRMEPVKNRPRLTGTEQKKILGKLIHAALFERFLNKKYVGVTRFSLEGGDAVIPLLDMIVKQAVSQGCREVILGMAHRGRLNVQSHILKKPYEELFREFENCYEPDQLLGAGDVKYHNGYLADIKLETGADLRIFLVNNPSHLEAVDPVVEGIVRARQENYGQDKRVVMPLLIHGDAAFSGQGIVAETLNMSQLAGYATGGTVHVIINNQIGYTTLPEDARSTRYSTDIAKMLMVPIFHVHGEDAEAVVHVGKLAVEYRNRFEKDVVVDVVCYRRYGHNEGDEPYFTQPLMYGRIKERPSPHRQYADQLIAEKIVDSETVAQMEKDVYEELDSAYRDVHGSDCLFPEVKYFEAWDGYSGKYSHEGVDTAVSKQTVLNLAQSLNTFPDGFKPHAKLKRLLDKRLKVVQNGEKIDWANAESLAFASLLVEGFPIRLSGQDVGRGTFSQRHSVLFDTDTGKRYIPLNHLTRDQAAFVVYNSLLAEAGVLGFEYGYAATQPDRLVLWEAQFGDFANSAQTIIDLFIAAGETKWERLCGLVMLLPHGWEGLGPEHSSARLERFLQLCADDNLQVCNLTTPSQYFHLLRRQIHASFRKPLVLMTPKSLLRHPMAVSSLSSLASDRFHSVLDDPDKPEKATRVVLCSGKIYYQLINRRRESEGVDTAIIRLEQFFPFPEASLASLLKTYKQTMSWVWAQEEPENMGGWQFVKPRIEAITGEPLHYVGRKPSASPATGFPAIYRAQQEAITDALFKTE
ncbi:MAG: 2-oxoglutarate dehydrogenase E1 component [Deltaproteobacteria bacterium]|nr:2-oxoglutarate dehydrogenase E1 component [Deltaproteobacteria bacterium]